MRARIVRESDGTIVKDSGRSSKIYMTKKEYEEGTKLFEVNNLGPRPVVKTVKQPYTPMKKLREQYYTELQLKAYQEMQKRDEEPVNPVIKPEFGPTPAKRAKKNIVEETVNGSILPGGENSPYPYNELITLDRCSEEFEIPRVRPARRAEDIKDCTDIILNENDNQVDLNKIEAPGMYVADSDGIHPAPLTKEQEREINSAIENLKKEVYERTDVVLGNDEQEELIKPESYESLPDGTTQLNFADGTEDSEPKECNLTHEFAEALREIINTNKPIEYGVVNGVEIIKGVDNFAAKIRDDVATLNTLKEIAEYAEEFGLFEEESEDEETTTFSEEMEADVFPELSNVGINMSSNLDVETDYSNYEPPEYDNQEDHDEDEEIDYSNLFRENRKEKKRNNKQQKNKKYVADDMSEY
jgi:hypothetical protein